MPSSNIFQQGAGWVDWGLMSSGHFPAWRGLTATHCHGLFTKAYSLPDQEVETIVEAMVEGRFRRFGAPEVVHTDQGMNF